MEWFKKHSLKVLTGWLTVLTLADGYDPSILTDAFSDSGKHWVLFALAVASFGLTTLSQPRAPDTLPPPRHQGGHARLAVLIVLAVLGCLIIASSPRALIEPPAREPAPNQLRAPGATDPAQRVFWVRV